MAVSLFPHNQTAYENVCAMLEKTGKAAVIHPTGTGKSFIGFKYAEDHPQEKILWLAPSEYIFKTQLENWFSACGTPLPRVFPPASQVRKYYSNASDEKHSLPYYYIKRWISWGKRRKELKRQIGEIMSTDKQYINKTDELFKRLEMV